jgi:hypothetical protein
MDAIGFIGTGHVAAQIARAVAAAGYGTQMTTGRQWIATDFGVPEVLRLRKVDVPSPGPGEVTILVRAAGMNRPEAGLGET